VLDQQVLRTIRVLVLVYHHELKLARVSFAHGRRLIEQLDGLEQEIVEVQRAAIARDLRTGQSPHRLPA